MRQPGDALAESQCEKREENSTFLLAQSDPNHPALVPLELSSAT